MAAMAAVTPGAPPRRDSSMSLLTDLMQNSLDPGYADAAARRRAGEVRRRSPLLLLVGLAAVGLLFATAAAQTHGRASSAAQDRDVLAGEVTARSAANDRFAASLERQRERVSAARQDTLRLTAEGQRLARTLSTSQAATGTGAVRGPALVVTLDDAPAPDPVAGADVDPRSNDDTNGRVTDRDLQTVVNEVWGAGAEAVTVNGQRLTSLSAIRSAGDAVLVDFRPLTPPYEITGIGDPSKVRTRFTEGFGGSYLEALKDYGITYSLATRESVRLPASAGVTLRYATTPTRTESGS